MENKEINIKTLARIIGVFVIMLGVSGIIMGEKQVVNTNMDLMLDLTRIALGLILIASTFKDDEIVKAAFGIFGAVYVANFATAMVSPKMFGLLPHKYGAMDNVLHSVGGILGIGIALTSKSISNKLAVR
jgi:hypothetical protein